MRCRNQAPVSNFGGDELGDDHDGLDPRRCTRPRRHRLHRPRRAFGRDRLGLWGGVGTLVLVFVFGLDPGEPPISAILIIIAVISAAAAMQAAGGVDYMVQIASAALRARPKALNFVGAVRLVPPHDPHRHEQHLLLDHPRDQRGRLREQDPAGARARRVDCRQRARDHLEPGRGCNGDDVAAGRDLRLRPHRRPAHHRSRRASSGSSRWRS